MRNGSSSARDDPPGHGQGLGDGRSLRGQQRELVAAEARDQVVGPELLADPFGDGDQQLVTGRVPERVVDDLEVVEIEEDDDRRRRRFGARPSAGSSPPRRRPGGWPARSASRGTPGGGAVP